MCIVHTRTHTSVYIFIIVYVCNWWRHRNICFSRKFNSNYFVSVLCGKIMCHGYCVAHVKCTFQYLNISMVWHTHNRTFNSIVLRLRWARKWSKFFEFMSTEYILQYLDIWEARLQALHQTFGPFLYLSLSVSECVFACINGRSFCDLELENYTQRIHRCI